MEEILHHLGWHPINNGLSHRFQLVQVHHSSSSTNAVLDSLGRAGRGTKRFVQQGLHKAGGCGDNHKTGEIFMGISWTMGIYVYIYSI